MNTFPDGSSGQSRSRDQVLEANEFEDEERRRNREILRSRLQEESRRNITTPTRTLRLTQEEQSNSRDPTPLEISNRSSRPRTPRQRFESPLEQHETFLPAADVAGEEDDEPSRRITIRLNAGLGVGVQGPMARLRSEDIASKEERSAKQGPSHRKVRRWNNDRLVDLDLTSAKVKNIYAKARSEAHLYRAIYNPTEDHQRSETMSRFIQDDAFKGQRDKFFDGSGPVVSSPAIKEATCKPTQSLACIEPRLRRLIIRACQNSCAATKVMQRLEDYLLHRFFPDNSRKELQADWWSDLLMEEPTTVEREHLESNGSVLCLQFSFQLSHSSGFHRLLLHALCQFHGLKANAKNSKSENDARTSFVSGAIAENHEQQPISLISSIEERERILTS